MQKGAPSAPGAQGPENAVLAGLELLGDSPRRHPGQVGMRFGVIAYRVATVGNLAHQFRAGAREAAHQEKSCGRAVTLQQGKKLWRTGGIGAIVKRKRDGGCVECVVHRGAKNLGGGIHRSPCGYARAGGGCGREQNGPGVHCVHQGHSGPRALSHAHARRARVTFLRNLASKTVHRVGSANCADFWARPRAHRAARRLGLGPMPSPPAGKSGPPAVIKVGYRKRRRLKS